MYSVVLLNSAAAIDRVKPEDIPNAIEGVSGEWLTVEKKPGNKIINLSNKQ